MLEKIRTIIAWRGDVDITWEDVTSGVMFFAVFYVLASGCITTHQMIYLILDNFPLCKFYLKRTKKNYKCILNPNELHLCWSA